MTAIPSSLYRLGRQPAFVLFSVGTIAAGIAATMVAFSILYQVAWHQTGISHPQELAVVSLVGSTAHRPALSWSDVVAIREQQRSFSAIAVWAAFQSALVTPSASRLIAVEAVSGEYFGVLGIKPAIGRVPFGLAAAGRIISDSGPIAVGAPARCSAATMAKYGGAAPPRYDLGVGSIGPCRDRGDPG
jgi:putative ABC transport system permease protein